jgi:hypothetical protein
VNRYYNLFVYPTFMDMMTMIMSVGWDYISELRPLTGLLFIPRWYEDG